MRRILLAALVTFAATSTAHAQFSVNLGVALPARNDADAFNAGVHLGAALKVPLLPFQIEGAYDRMGGKDDGPDLNILSAQGVIPLNVTPPLVPVSAYLLAGGGVYNTDADQSSTDIGITGGGGVRFRLPGLSPFAEGRGILIFSEGNKVTYLTVSAGLRF